MWTADKSKIKHPGYTGRCFEPDRFRVLVDQAAETMVEIMKVTPFDAIAGSGNSGALLCAALSYKTGIPIITVRKENEPNAEGAMATGHVINTRYLLVDDMISGGRTARRMIKEIGDREQRYISARHKGYEDDGTKFLEPLALSECVGIMLYHEASPREAYELYKWTPDQAPAGVDPNTFVLPVHNVFERGHFGSHSHISRHVKP